MSKIKRDGTYTIRSDEEKFLGGGRGSVSKAAHVHKVAIAQIGTEKQG